MFNEIPGKVSTEVLIEKKNMYIYVPVKEE